MLEWEDCIKMYLKEIDVRLWIGLVQFRLESIYGLMRTQYESSSSVKARNFLIS
jgi:hypothetical protein